MRKWSDTLSIWQYTGFHSNVREGDTRSLPEEETALIQYVPKRLQYTDLYVNQYGIEACAAGHDHGPAVRDHYLIHYILSGTGIFKVGDCTYTLHAGEGFLICPQAVTYYQADGNNPWHYCWVGFHGHQAEAALREAGLSQEQPIFRYNRDSALHDQFMKFIHTDHLNTAGELHLIGTLYALLSMLIELQPHPPASHPRHGKKEAYAAQVIAFIEAHYADKISIAEIARYVGLDRSYLCSLFQDCVHTSMQEYLIQFRMKKAIQLLDNPLLAIGDVARSVGYQDPLLFSKIFKKHAGVSPRHYRERHLL